jgi:CRISPR-associated protein Cas1
VDVHTVLVGEDTNVTSAAVRAAGRHGVSLLFCDWRGVPVTAAAGFSSHTLAGERQRGQVTLSVPRRKQAWAAVVRAKITGQANLLRKIGDSEGDAALRSLVGAESPRVL